MSFFVGEDDGNDSGVDQGLVFTLRVMAAWRKCSCCHQTVLYVGTRGQTDDEFICGACACRKEDFAHELAYGNQ